MIDDAQLIENLLHHDLLTQSEIDHARTLQRPNVSLYNTMLEEEIGREEDILAVAAKVLGLPYVNLTQFDYDRDAVSFLSQSIAERNTVFPLTMRETEIGQQLVLAMTDPLDIMTMDEIATHTGVDIQPILAGPRDIRDAIAYAYADISQAVDDPDPFANLRPMGDGPRNPGDSWAAFFTDANARLASDSEVPAIPASIHEEPSLGLFDEVSPASSPKDSPGSTSMGTPKPNDSNMFGKFFIDESRKGVKEFNSTMLGSPFQAVLPKAQPSQPPKQSPQDESNIDEFDFFGEAQASLGQESSDLVELSEVEHNSHTQVAGFKHHEIPRSNPRAKKLASLKKKLKQPTPDPALPEVPPMTTDLDEDMDFNSIVEEAAEAASEVMDETHHNAMAASADAQDPEQEEDPSPPPAPNALGRLKLKKLAISSDKSDVLKIVEKTKVLPPVPPMPKPLALKPSPILKEEPLLEEVEPILEEVDVEDIEDLQEVSIEELSEPSLRRLEREPGNKAPSRHSQDNRFGLPQAITGTSTTAVETKPSAPVLEIIEDESELDFEPDFDLEFGDAGGLEQTTEANAKVTIEYAQQMQVKAPISQEVDVPTQQTQEVGSALDALSDAQLLRALVRTLVARGVLNEAELLAHAKHDEDEEYGSDGALG